MPSKPLKTLEFSSDSYPKVLSLELSLLSLNTAARPAAVRRLHDTEADNTQIIKEDENKMKKYHIFSTEDNRTIPIKGVVPSDFSDGRYEGRYLMEAQDGTPVVILSSISAEPARWRVVHGANTSYFLSHQQAMNYCRECSYKFAKGGVRE